MSGQNTSVMGIYADAQAARLAIDALTDAGFRPTDISVLQADNAGGQDFVHAKESKAPEGTAMGTFVGALLGTMTGWMGANGLISLPGGAVLSASGTWLASLAGLGAGGLIGGLIGAALGAGVPEYEAKRYAGITTGGKALLSVHCDKFSWVAKAKDVLEGTGGRSVAARLEARASGRRI